jgi:peptide/nickel transport system substrate-binding protein
MFVLLVLLCLLWRAVPATAATFPIADAVIDPDRTRVPAGKLTIAVHVSLSPKWLNPQDNPGGMAYEMLWKVHDNMIKAGHGHVYSYALAEFYDMSPDFTVATVRLREGLKFHNGDPVTAEDVAFSYENYHGINATFLHDKTARVERVDNRTVQFHFKEPFPDFLLYYGTTGSAAGVIIPKNY